MKSPISGRLASIRAAVLPGLCALFTLLFGALAAVSVLREPVDVKQYTEIVDIAASQRKNAFALVRASRDAASPETVNQDDLKNAASNFLGKEKEIRTFLLELSELQLEGTVAALQSQELIDSKITVLKRELAPALGGEGRDTVSRLAAEEIRQILSGPFLNAVDNRVKHLANLIVEEHRRQAMRYLILGSTLLLMAGVSGAGLFAARARSLKEAHSLLIKRNAQMETVEEVSKVGYWEVDLTDQQPMWSRQTRSIHEVDESFKPDLQTAIDFYAPEYRDQITEAVQVAMKTGTEWDLELEIITAKGNRRWVRAKGRPIYKDGTLVSLVGSFQDITATKKRELELSEALQQKDLALAEVTDLSNAIHSAAIVTIANSDGKIIQTNQQFTEISGYSEAEVLGQDHSILNSGHHNKEFFVDLWHTIAKGEVWRGEICNKAKNGALYWVDTTIYPILGDDEKPQRYMSIRFDVTKRIQASKMASNYFDVSLAPNCIVDANGVFLKVNDAFCDMLGLPRQKIEGRPFSDFVCEDDLSVSIEELNRLNMGGKTAGFRNKYRVASGKSRVIEWQARQFDSLIFASARDITAILQQEEALSAARQSAEETSNTKSAFLANMSHEIRTPLNGIIGVADVLASDMALTRDQAELVKMISDSGRILEKLLSDILDFSKIEAGKLSIEEAPFSLEDEVRAALDLHMIDAEGKGVDFQLKFECPTGLKVLGDSLRMRQILSNLASNAVKFTEQGRITASAEVRQEAGKWHLDFSIQDTGIGFPTATQGEVFERFDQKRASDARHFGGSGLGLAISASLAELMNGTLKVDSMPGVGTRFDLSLSLDTAPEEPIEASDKAAPGNKSDILKGLNILVAEDMKANQKVLSLLLSPMGCKITFADNGLEAVNLYRRSNYDVVLLDMMMPEMDGLEAAVEIRKIEAEGARVHTPIAMLSANAMREHVESSRLAGCDTHISKPVNRNKIVEGVRYLLSQDA